MNLRETYHELGSYDFKVVLNERFFKNGHGFDLKLVDSAGKPLKFEAKVWGRKIVCNFEIDPSVEDGVSHIKLALRTEKGERVEGKLDFWVIKP